MPTWNFILSSHGKQEARIWLDLYQSYAHPRWRLTSRRYLHAHAPTNVQHVVACSSHVRGYAWHATAYSQPSVSNGAMPIHVHTHTPTWIHVMPTCHIHVWPIHATAGPIMFPDVDVTPWHSHTNHISSSMHLVSPRSSHVVHVALHMVDTVPLVPHLPLHMIWFPHVVCTSVRKSTTIIFPSCVYPILARSSRII